MANLITKARTNYFMVKDIPAFQAELSNEKYQFEDIEMVTKEIKGETHVAVIGQVGFATVYKPEEDEYVDFTELVQPHILPGEACIVTEIGYEKLRTVFGEALVITADDSMVLDLKTASQNAAKQMLKNFDKEFEMNY